MIPERKTTGLFMWRFSRMGSFRVRRETGKE
jgi:hypothetical protein